MAQATIKDCPGLVIGANHASIPPGALKKALGVMVRRPGLIEHRRSWAEVYQPGLGTDCLFQRAGKVYAVLSNNSVVDTTGAVASAAGSIGFSHTTSSRIKAIDAAGCTYFLTGPIGTGQPYPVKKMDWSAVGATFAGAPRCLDLMLSGVNSATGFLQPYSAVGYRACYAYLDGSKKLVRGAPSGRFVYSSGGVAQNVVVTIPLHASITNARPWFVQIYRTGAKVGSVSVPPADPLDSEQLVYESLLQAADYSGGSFAVTDLWSELTPKGADLYTNSAQEGAAAPNWMPPSATTGCLYRGSLVLGNVAGKFRTTIALIGVPDVLVTTSVFSVGGGNTTIQIGNSPDLSLFTPPPGDTTCKVSIGTSTPGTGSMAIGDYLLVSTDNVNKRITISGTGTVGTITGTVYVAGLSLFGTGGDGSIYASFTTESGPGRSFVPATTGTTGQQLAGTAQSIIRSINKDTASYFHAFYASGPDDPPGMIELEERVQGSIVNSGVNHPSISAYVGGFAIKWGPALYQNSSYPLWRQILNDAVPNRIAPSKAFQTEAFSPSYTQDIGSLAAIDAVVASRDTLWIFKQDGLFRATGDAGAYYIQKFDETVRLVDPSLITVMNNTVYAVSTRGILAITENGAKTISGNIQPIAESISSGQPGAVIGNERDNVVYFFAGSSYGASLCYCANTSAWTTDASGASLANVVGVFDPASGSVFRTNQYSGLATATNSVIVQEARLGVSGGYADVDTQRPADSYNMATNAANSNFAPGTGIIAFAVGSHPVYAPAVGDLVASTNGGWDTTYYRILSITTPGGYNLCQLDAVPLPWSTGNYPGSGIYTNFTSGAAAVVYKPIGVDIEWHPFSEGDEADNRHFREVQLILEAPSANNDFPLAFTGSSGYAGAGGYLSCWNENLLGIYSGSATPPIEVAMGSATVKSGGSLSQHCLVQREYQRGRRLSVRYRHIAPFECLAILAVSYVWREYSDANKNTGA